MRSFERVAREKGWIKEEPIKKEAEAADLSVSINLTENIIKLCSGLRNSGLHKYADEIEQKFMNYKKAQSLYETSKETGEDLVDAAHPKGSHKLENVDSTEAVIETIIDNHLAHVKMIDKKPTGKLASSKDILKAVKTVLAREETTEDLLNAIKNKLVTINGIIRKLDVATKDELTFPLSGPGGYMSIIAGLSTNPTLDNLKKIKDTLGRLYARLDPSSWLHYTTLGASGLTEDTWSQVQGMLGAAQTAAQQAIEYRVRYNSIISEQKMAPAPAAPLVLEEVKIQGGTALTPLLRQVHALKSKVSSWGAIGTIANNPALMQWVRSETAALDNIVNRYSTAEDQHPDQITALVPSLQREIASETTDINAFETKYIKGS
jgi:hypothetical protein